MFESLKLAVRELLQKGHFLVLLAFAILGTILDGHSTFVGVSRLGYGPEQNPIAVFLWQKLEFLGWPFNFVAEQIISLLGWITVWTLLSIFLNKIMTVLGGESKFWWKLSIYFLAGVSVVRFLIAFWNYSQIF